MSNDLGPLPKVHPRRLLVAEARLEFSKAYFKICEKLTYAERMSILADMLHADLCTCVRAERNDDDG